MTWLHGPPAKAPAMPQHVDLEGLLGEIAKAEAQGQSTPASSYLRLAAPKVQLDKWGAPLPLTDVDQDRIDRLFAVLVEPLERSRRLIRSGLLIHDEADAVKTAFPEIYTVLVQELLRDMMASAPPYREWAETTIGVLFGMPPAQLLASAEAPEKMMAKQEAKDKKPEPTPDMSGTAADRREISVRKELR